jgi:hypothetical protein
MRADVAKGTEMLRGKLQRIGATLGAVLVLSACSGTAEDPEVADLDEVLAATEEETEPPADASDSDASDSDDAEVAGDEAVADAPTEGTGQPDDAPETADGDPYAIPEDGIDEAYVKRVLNAILDVNRQALTITLDSEPGGLIPFEAEERLRAIYGHAYGAAAYRSLSEIAGDANRRSDFRNPPGAVSVAVVDIIDVAIDCLTVELEMDFSNVVSGSSSPRTEYLALAPRSIDHEPNVHNPTPWVVADGDMTSVDGLSCS